MQSVLKTTPSIETLADLLGQLGGIDPARVRFVPAPGTATEQDVIDTQEREGRLCELVERVLVEKAVGFRESWLASVMIYTLLSFVKPRDLGIVTGEAGLIRLAPGLVRIPDVAFIAWERLPDRRIPTEPVPGVIPSLAVEVVSAGNTPGEMTRKLREYFAAGVQMVWLVDPRARTVEVYETPEQSILLRTEETLDGGRVLPGFTLPLQELFAELDRQGM